MIENRFTSEKDISFLQDIDSSLSNEVNLIELISLFELFQPADLASKQQTKLHYFRNNDGTIRWIWPSKAKHAYFLDLYSQGNFKSRLFGFVAKYVFAFGLGRFFKHGVISLDSAKYGNLIHTDWALFTGTIGPNRKAILRLGKDTTIEYHKFPLSAVANENLKNEQTALRFLDKSNSSKFFDFPEIIESNSSDVFKQESLKGENLHTESDLKNLDLASFIDWNSANIQTAKPSFKKHSFNKNLFNPKFINNLEDLANWCEKNPITISVPCHGDFTPWNCRMSGKRLQILDWEMFSMDGLPLEDLFHFIYQQGILVDRINLKELRTRIDLLVSNEKVIRFLAINNLNPLELELHYLNRNIHYYLNVYSNQKNLHLQVHWLLDTWNQSLAYLLIALNNSVRKSVLANFQESISSLNYAVLKFSDDDLSQISFLSDIDLCTTRLDAKKMIRFFEEHEFVHSIKVKKLGKMIQLEARLLDNSRIDVDLIFRFRRTFIDYLNVNDVLNSRVQNSKGLWLASKESNANYVLNFYILNNSEIPEKHRVWVEQPEIVEIEVIKNRIWKRKENTGVHLLLNHLSYALEIMRSMGNKQRGFLITFSGVDGAGKSTIIEIIKNELEKKHRRRVIVIRHRPSILPIISAFKYGKKNAEQKSASTLPRQGTNSSKASSLLRFAYYLSDYVFGQWWIYFRHVRKNTIVLYDRYYFDFINDSRRSNIALNPAFTEQFYKLLRKPEFNFFLWASPELILRRKQELDADTIQALTERYSGLFERLQSKDSEHVYQCIENIEIEATLNLMMRIIGKKMHEADFYPTNTIEKS